MVGPAGRAGSVVRGREVVRVVVGVGDFGDAALVARVVAGAGAAVVGAVAAACVVLGTRRSVGAGAAAAPLVTTAAATTVRTAASPARVRAVARRAMARRVPTASRRFRSDVTSGRSGRMAMMSSTSVDDHVLTAFNTATASTNKIHDDDVARQYGFRGGLVPGVDVYAYLTHLPVREWGRAWLEDGWMTARFITPVYDGHEVTASGRWDGDDLDLVVTDGATTCATGRAGRPAPATAAEAPPAASLPSDPPPASASVLRPGTVLGTIVDRFDAAAHTSYLADVRETLPLYAAEGIAHPGWVLRFANSALSRNVVLGPWIHVSSDVALLGVVHDGEEVAARAVVLDEFERKGHRFVTMDVAISADDHPVQRVTHTAIHTPRRQA